MQTEPGRWSRSAKNIMVSGSEKKVPALHKYNKAEKEKRERSIIFTPDQDPRS